MSARSGTSDLSDLLLSNGFSMCFTDILIQSSLLLTLWSAKMCQVEASNLSLQGRCRTPPALAASIWRRPAESWCWNGGQSCAARCEFHIYKKHRISTSRQCIVNTCKYIQNHIDVYIYIPLYTGEWWIMIMIDSWTAFQPHGQSSSAVLAASWRSHRRTNPGGWWICLSTQSAGDLLLQ